MKKSGGGAALGGWGHSFQAVFMCEDELLSNHNMGSSLSPQDHFIQRAFGSKGAVYWRLCLDKIFLLLCRAVFHLPESSCCQPDLVTHTHTCTHLNWEFDSGKSLYLN